MESAPFFLKNMRNNLSKEKNNQDDSCDGDDDHSTLDEGGAEGTALSVYRLAGRECTPMNAIWNPQSAMHLRKFYGLTGDLSGTMPKHPSQNQHLTMPLLLTEEEVTYGVSHGSMSVISEGPSSYAPVSDASVRAFYSAREAHIDSHVETVVQHHEVERAKRKKDVNSIPRKRKLSEIDPSQNGAQKLSLEHSSLSTPSPGVGDGNISPLPKRQRTGIMNAVAGSLRHLLYTLTGTCYFAPSDPQVAPAEGNPDNESDHLVVVENGATPIDTSPTTETDDITEVESARQEVLETKIRKQAATTVLLEAGTEAREDEEGERVELNSEFARRLPPRSHARQVVFNDLRKRGFSLTCGAKFGADFLAYATDPLLVHASLAVVVIDGDEDISTYDVVALGRLGDATRKRTVLAWVDDSSEGLVDNHVNYIGIQWEETLP